MIPVYQIPRNSLAWLLGAYLFAVLPHAYLHLPAWIWGTLFIALTWRIQVYRGLWSFPPRALRYMLALLCTIGVFVGYESWRGLEPMVALLITAFTLKLLETHTRKDVLLVVYLSYFVGATLCLINQSILAALYLIVAVLVSTTALLGLNQAEGHKWPLRSLKTSGKLLLQAMPLALLLFLVMPRLGALWSVPLPEGAGKTGVSDSMSPGDFSNLVRSGELAFRVTFAGTAPPEQQLYWRGLTFSHFDGRTWREGFGQQLKRSVVITDQGMRVSELSSPELVVEGNSIDYQVILEPTQQPFLYSLPMVKEVGSDAELTPGFQIKSKRPITKRKQYSLSSYPNYVAEPELSERRRAIELRLPDDFNPQTRALVQGWRAAGMDDQAVISAFLNKINESFFYTLSPPKLGKDSVDEFLFSTRQGFCEHFSSSFVFAMRAAGIPARVVAGYQGGEVNPFTGAVLVHQYDAHAWAEVWLPGKGWRRVDPTGYVARERILDDASQLGSFAPETPLALVNFKSVPFVNWARLQLDRMDYAWHRFVLGYDTDMQANLFQHLLGGNELWRIGLVVGGILVVFFATFLMWFRLSIRPVRAHRADQYYQRFTAKLARAGIARKPGETPSDYAQRASESRSDLATAIKEITALFLAIRYKPAQAGIDVRSLRDRVKRFSV